MRWRRIWRDHSLGIILVGCVAALGTLYWFAGLYTWRAEEQAHHQPPAPVFPDYLFNFLVNYAGILGDLCGVTALVFLTKWFTERGSDAGDDPDVSEDGT